MAACGVSEDGDAGFQIAPMVDVVFVLLLFFMAAAGSQIQPKELGMNLPGKADPNKVSAVTPILIVILPDGRISMNDRIYDTPSSKDLPELRAWLAETIEKFGDRDPVIIRPDPQTKHERIIDVLDAAAAVGIKNLTFG
jgi:biopolymer transport protein ExbD